MGEVDTRGRGRHHRGVGGARWMVWVLVGLAGCGADEAADPLRLELPIRAEHQAVVVGLEVDGSPVALTAADILGGEIPPVLQALSEDGAVDVTALLYASSLEALELEAGPLTPSTAVEGTRPLPEAAEVHRAHLEGAETAGWRALDELPPALAAVRLPAVDPCVRFEPQRLSFGVAQPPTSALAVDDTWALIMTEGPEVFFTDGSQVVRQDVPVPLFSGYRRADGEVWLGGDDGAIFRGAFTASPEPQLTLTRDSTVRSDEDVIDLVGAPDGPLEHFAMTTNREEEQWGAFEWYDGAQWRVPGLRRNTPHDATWVERGFGLFTSFFRDGEIFGARDGQETSIEVTSVLLGNVVVIEQVPGFGLVSATTAGDVHRLGEDGVWRRITGSTTHRIGDVHGYEDGLVFLRGTAVAFYPADGTECPDSALFAPDEEALNHMEVVGEHVVVPLVDRDGGGLAEQHVGWYARMR